MSERSRQGRPTGPAPPEEEVTEIPLVLDDGAVRRRRPYLAEVAEARRSPDDDAHTRKIDTKPLVSAAFEEEDDPSEELGFDKPLFMGEAEEAPTPQAMTPLAAAASTTESSVVVDLDFDDADELTPKSLWAARRADDLADGLADVAASQVTSTSVTITPVTITPVSVTPVSVTPVSVTPVSVTPASPVARRERPRPSTGPHLPRQQRPSGEFVPPGMGSARKKDRTTGRLRQQARPTMRGRGRALTYVIVGALAGLGAGLFLGLYRSGGDAQPKASRLSSTSNAAIAHLAARRSLAITERKALSKLRRAMDDGRWGAAQRTLDALPKRLRDDIVLRGWLGRIQRGTGQLQASIATLKPLPSHAPAAALRVELEVELAESYLAVGDKTRACAAAQRAKQDLGADASEALASRVIRLLKRCSP